MRKSLNFRNCLAELAHLGQRKTKRDFAKGGGAQCQGNIGIGTAGFTLVEVIVYAVLIGILFVALLLNLRGAQTNKSFLDRAANGIISELRRAQIMAISGLNFQGSAVCGYGVHYVDPDTYLIYAGGEAVCGTANRNYQGGSDFSVQTIKILENNVEFKSSFNDVFFEPPDPKTFINNSFSLSSGPLAVSIGFKNQICPAGCKTINIHPSGKIDSN